MKTRKLLSALAASALLAAAIPSHALTAKVTGVGIYPTGAIFIFFDRPVSDCSTHARLDIPAESPAAKQIFALASTAFATESNVEVRAGSCNGVYPSWTSTGDSWFYLSR